MAFEIVQGVEAQERVKQAAAEAKRRRARARGRSRQARQQAIARLAATTKLTQTILAQVRQRFAEEKISDRLVSLADPEARPVRRGKRARPTEFGYVVQLRELTPHTRRGARGLILPPKLRAGSTPENTLLRKLQMIDDATTDQDLRVPPSNHFERLGGKLDGLHSIRVDKKWRLIFQWDGGKGEATGVYLDSHGYK